ncbi:hypothetical protein F0P96_05265 [Hymenobacter busanensis]|uniref:Uncharacterized protein n=1 Tax=Hymenobacter busanensis TaxID=2607656 RepID=A0A7L5A2C4_9BACT|nr:hypothetical protein [Hymenobacter busanensis]KAA9338254.1 hypothetical protein F0P96_05265 [Hymenobacter busanensis]QHJ09323.1 hypothetical protein GUY19_19350 [Hymenobacter busanensis]
MPFSARRCAAALLLFFPLACQRGETERDGPTETVAPTETAAVLARRLSPLLRGVWVRAEYLETLQRTRSPQAAAGQLRDIVALAINPARRAGDSLLVETNLNNHEAGQFMLYFRPGRKAASLPTSRVDYDREGGFYELAYVTSGTDTTLQYQHFNKREKPLETLSFRRVRGLTAAPGATAEAVQRVANAVLAGSYTALDSAGRRSRVRLRPDGTVQGLPGVRSFRLATDFAQTLANDRDNLLLNPGSKRPQLCTYTLRGDTLRLYAARIVEPELRQGHLRYTLVRQRP